MPSYSCAFNIRATTSRNGGKSTCIVSHIV